MYFLKTIHKWLGLAIGIQLCLWLLSGLVFNLLDPQQVKGRALAAESTPTPIQYRQPLVNHRDIAALYPGQTVKDITLTTLLGRTVYRVTLADRIDLRDAGSGEAIRVTAAMARTLAERDYTGAPADIGAITAIAAPTLETRRHRGLVWQVAIDDRVHTTLYISAEDGRLLERRNDTWRLFDFFWMLHIMDYRGRQDFNNMLVIAAAFGCLWLTLSGFILLINSFRSFGADFPIKLRRRSFPVKLFDQRGTPIRTLRLPAGATLFDGLADQSIPLPSRCGGGGSCGRCQVRITTETRVTDEERRLIAPKHLSKGYRLACRQRVEGPLSLEVWQPLD